MDFTTLRELNAIVKALNSNNHKETIERKLTHMYRDGRWSTTLNFGETPELKRMEKVLSFCLANDIYTFFGCVNGNIYLFIQ